MHPPTERLDRPFLFLQSLGKIGQLLDFVAVNRLKQGFARWKMAVERADTDSRRSRDGFEARFRTTGAEHGSCRFEQAIAVPLRVGARLS